MVNVSFVMSEGVSSALVAMTASCRWDCRIACDWAKFGVTGYRDGGNTQAPRIGLPVISCAGKRRGLQMGEAKKYGPGRAMPAPMPIEELRSIFGYDRDTGIITWLVERGCNAGRIHPGDVAGTLKKSGYIVIRIGKVGYYAHRIAWAIETGEWLASKIEIDHRNEIKSDNRWDNFRLATRAQNQMNWSRRNKTGFRGVFANGDKFVAKISINGKRINLPTRATAEESHADYVRAAHEHHGDFARTS